MKIIIHTDSNLKGFATHLNTMFGVINAGFPRHTWDGGTTSRPVTLLQVVKVVVPGHPPAGGEGGGTWSPFCRW